MASLSNVSSYLLSVVELCCYYCLVRNHWITLPKDSPAAAIAAAAAVTVFVNVVDVSSDEMSHATDSMWGMTMATKKEKKKQIESKPCYYLSINKLFHFSYYSFNSRHEWSLIIKISHNFMLHEAWQKGSHTYR